MEFYDGGGFEMKEKKAFLVMPEKVFGIESALLKLFLFPLGVFLLFFVSLKLVILPQIDEVKRVKNELAQVKKDQQEVNTKRTYLLTVDQEELKKNSKALERALLSDRNAYLVVGVVRQIAARYGFRVESFSVTIGELLKEEEATAEIAELPIKTLLLGPAESYLDLVEALETSLPVLSLKEFDVAIRGMAEVELTVAAYFLPADVEADIKRMSLTDLTLSQEEAEVISKVAYYQETGGVVEASFGDEDKSFKSYPIRDPFGL